MAGAKKKRHGSEQRNGTSKLRQEPIMAEKSFKPLNGNVDSLFCFGLQDNRVFTNGNAVEEGNVHGISMTQLSTATG